MFNCVIQNKQAKCYITFIHYFLVLRHLDSMLIFFVFVNLLMFPCVCRIYCL